MQSSFIHVYTGDGKGKTTAALGLALRAACAGKKVYFAQFIKGGTYHEMKASQWLPGFQMDYFGQDCFIDREPASQDIALARKGLSVCQEILKEGRYDLVVLDEINIALYFNLFTVEEVLGMLERRAPHVEVVLTGRKAPPEIIDKADLVTEMKEIKHYYRQGVMAREGIEK